ncbi:MAG: hypothetical protein ACYC2H_01050 [Thermoplasmatota archaeon]
MGSFPDVPIRLRSMPAAGQVPTEVVRAHLLIGHAFDRDKSCKALADRIGVAWEQILSGLQALHAESKVKPNVSVWQRSAEIVKEVATAIECACEAAGPPSDEALHVEPCVRSELEELEEDLSTWFQANPFDFVGPATEIGFNLPSFRDRHGQVVAHAAHLASIGESELLDVLDAIVVGDASKAPAKPARIALAFIPGADTDSIKARKELVATLSAAFSAMADAGKLSLDEEMGAMPLTPEILPARAQVFAWVYHRAERALFEALGGHIYGSHKECCATKPEPFLVSWTDAPLGDGAPRDEIERALGISKDYFVGLAKELADAQVTAPVRLRDAQARLQLQRNLPVLVLRTLAGQGEHATRAGARKALRQLLVSELGAVLKASSAQSRGPMEDQLLDRLVGYTFAQEINPGQVRLTSLGWHAVGHCPTCSRTLDGTTVMATLSQHPLIRREIDLPLRHAKCDPRGPTGDMRSSHQAELPPCSRCGQALWIGKPATIRDLMEDAQARADQRGRFHNPIFDALHTVEQLAGSMLDVKGAAPQRAQLRTALVDLESINVLSANDGARFPPAFAAVRRLMPGRGPFGDAEAVRAEKAFQDLAHWAAARTRPDPGSPIEFLLERGHAIHARCSDMSTSPVRGRAGAVVPG